MHAVELGEQAQHHEALDVVGVALLDDVAHGVRNAGHIRFAVPQQRRYGLVVVQGVAVGVARHMRPVDAAHELPPAQDLAHEALDAVQRRLPLVIGRDRGIHRFPRIEEMEIESGG